MIDVSRYRVLHPEAASHMLPDLGRPEVVDAGFCRCHPCFSCPFPGGFLAVELMDVRGYPPRLGWGETARRTPWRVYVQDYDDWSVERLFAREEDAREVWALLGIGEPLSYADIACLGLRET